MARAIIKSCDHELRFVRELHVKKGPANETLRHEYACAHCSQRQLLSPSQMIASEIQWRCERIGVLLATNSRAEALALLSVEARSQPWLNLPPARLQVVGGTIHDAPIFNSKTKQHELVEAL